VNTSPVAQKPKTFQPRNVPASSPLPRDLTSYRFPSTGTLIVSQSLIQGRYRTFSNGWNLRCGFCNSVYLASTRDIRRLSPRVQSCGCVAVGRRPRSRQPSRVRAGAPRHLGRVYGRLNVKEWVNGEGWKCVCDCGEVEFVRRSRLLGPRGMSRCPHLTDLLQFQIPTHSLPAKIPNASTRTHAQKATT